MRTSVVEAMSSKGRMPSPTNPRWSARAFARAWTAYMERTGISATDLTREMSGAAGCSVPTLYNWRKGEGKPDYDQGLALAEVLGCEYLDFSE